MPETTPHWEVTIMPEWFHKENGTSTEELLQDPPKKDIMFKKTRHHITDVLGRVVRVFNNKQ